MLALEESVWGIYRGNLDEKLQGYREKQRMFLAFFFAENVWRLGSVKKKTIGVCIFVVFSAFSYI